MKVEIKLSADGKGARVTLDGRTVTITEASPDLAHLDEEKRKDVVERVVEAIAGAVVETLGGIEPSEETAMLIQGDTLTWVMAHTEIWEDTGDAES
jgi:hypothetical protein